MTKIEQLANRYAEAISGDWSQTIAGAQRVIMVVYDKEMERNLRGQFGEFEQRTRTAGHGWEHFDCTRLFANWLGRDDDREAFFDEPEDLKLTVAADFESIVLGALKGRLQEADGSTVVAVSGIASLYGFLHISKLIRDVENDVRGRLVVFFPGSRHGNNYRLLYARDGWNYLARSVSLESTGV
jgi:hypothetical protein